MRLEKMLKQNPTRMDYYARYHQIIENYNNEKDRMTIEKTFEELLKFVNDLSKEEKRAAKEGLTLWGEFMAEIKFEIKETTGVLSESPKGWKKELNLISWNDKESKYYI